MPHVDLDGLAFAYADEAPILSGADLRLDAGWTAVVGENGAGKTTLLRLVAGELAPGSGRVRLEPLGARVLLCPQEVAARGADLDALAARDGGEARRVRGALALDPAALARWETLSPGERKRWQIGAALAADPDVLLLDEPTNHADAEARALLAAALPRFRGVGLLVSHDRALVEGLAARTLRLHRGEARLWPLRYGAAREAWEAERRAAWDARTSAQAESRAARARLARARQARAQADAARSGGRRDPADRDGRSIGAKTVRSWAEARLGREVGRLRAAAERAAGEIPDPTDDVSPGASPFVGFERAPRPVLLSVAGEDVRAGDRTILRDVSVALGREGRVRVAGPNGAGKSSLLSALLARSTVPAGRLLHLPQELDPGEGPRVLGEVRALNPPTRGRVLSLSTSRRTRLRRGSTCRRSSASRRRSAPTPERSSS